ncbi:Listeria/Bacterioides repeat-containing protein [Trichlorobacter thiogenes]|uniref:Listeria/Bacterioides repeat-containing protein n=1 Tax=Trichlorobacter thiogenes TaxID=115783 RepID=A0A1T4RUX4_9BACT|nr:fibronectin type III domain-containing protein [Trichlorobacter thiogenes]SKA19697.1 Listeria/Bacterioides repeat-containing protein [Trichlorobacter thiogenes]
MQRLFLAVWMVLALTLFTGLHSLASAEDLTITIVGTNSGSVTVNNDTSKVCSSGTCTYSFSYGDLLTLKAAPTGAFFDGWSGTCAGTNTNCTITMTTDISVTASFTPVPPLTSPTPWMGSYPAGQQVSLACSDAAVCTGTSYCLGEGCSPAIAYSSPIVFSGTGSQVLRFRSTDNQNAVEPIRTHRYYTDSTFTYRFDRLWPQSEQLWYFQSPRSIALDGDGNIYVADTDNHRILKFDYRGNFIDQWGPVGFSYPSGIAVDGSNTVYIADTSNNTIKKYSSDGSYLASIGAFGTGQGQLKGPRAVAVDSSGNVYVADTGNNRIQKFAANGTFLWQLGESGSGNGQFNQPQGISVDSSGSVYVSDTGNNRVQKFVVSGDIVVYSTQWGSLGSATNQLNAPGQIHANSDGMIYLADKGNNRILVFSNTGVYSATLGANGQGDGQFSWPMGVAKDSKGYVYVADTSNDRIQQLTTAGLFIKQLAVASSADGAFRSPVGIARDASGNFYVADTANHRIQKFSSSGDFVASWGSFGSGDLQFSFPNAVAIDASGHIFVADTLNHRIQKLNSNGVFVATWGSYGSSGTAKFDRPSGIAVDSQGFVYVTDLNNKRVQKFTNAGGYDTEWGGAGSGDGKFNAPRGIAIDSSDAVYVADSGNNRIQKFTNTGGFVAAWAGLVYNPHSVAVGADGSVYASGPSTNSIVKITSSGQLSTSWGSLGSGNGQLNNPGGVMVDNSNNLYVVDTDNHRIQRFAPVLVPGAPTIGTATAGNGEAIVSFEAPANNGGNVITYYTVTSNPGNITASDSVSPITVTGLTNGTAYTFTVTATNVAGSGQASAASNSVTPLQPTVTLAVSLPAVVGNAGSGSVTSNPSGIACQSGSSAGCSASFAQDSSVELTASPNGISLFGSWTGCASVNQNICTVEADANKTVSALFLLSPKAKIGVNTFSSFDAAYDGAGDNAVVQLLEDALPFNRTINKPLTLQGGHLAGLDNRGNGFTTLEGTSLIIGSGKLVADRIVIKGASTVILE